jgi:hypothetical protein
MNQMPEIKGNSATPDKCAHSTKLTGQCVKCGEYPYDKPESEKTSAPEAPEPKKENLQQIRRLLEIGLNDESVPFDVLESLIGRAEASWQAYGAPAVQWSESVPNVAGKSYVAGFIHGILDERREVIDGDRL